MRGADTRAFALPANRSGECLPCSNAEIIAAARAIAAIVLLAVCVVCVIAQRESSWESSQESGRESGNLTTFDSAATVVGRLLSNAAEWVRELFRL